MTDTQFSPLGTVDAPADWRLPPSLELVLKAAQATFDGTGAGGSFQPALQIVSDSGHSVGIYPCDTTIAAGSSCEVSFFPFSPAAASSASSGIQFDTYPQAGDYLYTETVDRVGAANATILAARFPDKGFGFWASFATLILDSGGHDIGIVQPSGGSIDIVATKPSFGVLNLEAYQWFADATEIVITSGAGGIDMASSGAGDVVIHAGGTGFLKFQNLPVVNPGGVGRVWNNAGVLSIT